MPLHLWGLKGRLAESVVEVRVGAEHGHATAEESTLAASPQDGRDALSLATVETPVARASDAGAELAELAVRLTPIDRGEDRWRRTVMAADRHFDTGNLVRARTLLEDLSAQDLQGSVACDVSFRLAAIAESGSEHPLGQAVVRKAKEQGLFVAGPELFEAVSGHGLRAGYAGHAIMIGNRKMMADNKIAVAEDVNSTMSRLETEGKAATLVSIDGRLARIGGEPPQEVVGTDEDGAHGRLKLEYGPAAAADKGDLSGERGAERAESRPGLHPALERLVHGPRRRQRRGREHAGEVPPVDEPVARDDLP